MLNKHSNIAHYVDSLIVESILADNLVSKASAGSFIEEIKDKAMEYFKSYIDQDHPVKSIIDALAPAAIGMFLKAKFGWWGMLVGLAMNVFDIKITDILESICSKLKSLVGLSAKASLFKFSDNEITEDQIYTIVHSTVMEAFGADVTEEQEAKLKEPVKISLRKANILKVALMNYNENIISEAALGSSKMSIAGGLISILTWFFKIGFIAAGLLVASDIIKGLMGKPNHFYGQKTDYSTKEKHDSVEKPYSGHVSSQTKFPKNPTYKDERHDGLWRVPILANESEISNMLIKFTKDVYSGLDGLEDKIKSSQGFKSLVLEILFENRDNLNTNVVTIPGSFHTKKEIVDNFIDDISA